MQKLLWLSLILMASHTAHAKEQFSFRKWLNKFHLSLQAGYGRTHYTYQATASQGITMYKERGNFYIPFGNQPQQGHSNSGLAYQVRWFDGPYVLMPTYTDLSLLPEEDKAAGMTKFTGTATTIPITLSIYRHIGSKFRFGIGGTLFINSIESLQYKQQDEEDDQDLGTYKPTHTTHYRLRPILIGGFKFIENAAVSLLIDVHIGGADFVYAQLNDPIPVDVFLFGVQNIGLTLETHISEYLRAQFRLSYDHGDTVTTLPSSPKRKMGIVKEFNSILFQIGLSFNLPEIPRCPLPNCRIEVKHKHRGKPYRGVAPHVGRSLQGRRLYKK